MAAPVQQDLKKTVAFIYLANNKGELIPNGTGFFVSVPSKKKEGRVFTYFVTSKHVLQDSSTKHWFDKIYIRLNNKAEGVSFAEVPLVTEGESKYVFTHLEETVDLAVIPILPNTDTTDFKVIPSDMLTLKETFQEHHISEGTEVFFIGLLTQHAGREKNQPVVRFGRVALVPEESVNINGIEMDLYLMESFSFGGNSGSPVFFYLGPDSEPGVFKIGGEKYLLAGIMMGAFQDIQKVEVVQTATVPVSRSNIGISVVVPSYKLHEILYSRELNEFRMNQST